MTSVDVIRTQSVRVGRDSPVWAWLRPASTGTTKDAGGLMYLLSQNFLGTYAIWRDFLSYNTGASIPQNAVMSEVLWTVYIYQKNLYHDNTTQGVLTQSTQADATNVTLADYGRITLDSPEEAGPRFNLDSTLVYRYVYFTKDRYDWIKRAGQVSNNGVDNGYTLLCIRANKDVDDEVPIFLGCNIAFLNVFVPPYLTVTYTTATLFDATIEDGVIEG